MALFEVTAKGLSHKTELAFFVIYTARPESRPRLVFEFLKGSLRFSIERKRTAFLSAFANASLALYC